MSKNANVRHTIMGYCCFMRPSAHNLIRIAYSPSIWPALGEGSLESQDRVHCRSGDACRLHQGAQGAGGRFRTVGTGFLKTHSNGTDECTCRLNLWTPPAEVLKKLPEWLKNRVEATISESHCRTQVIARNTPPAWSIDSREPPDHQIAAEPLQTSRERPHSAIGRICRSAGDLASKLQSKRPSGRSKLLGTGSTAATASSTA